MYHPEQFNIAIIDSPAPPAPPRWVACLVPGCPCKDARIVSRRRAAFFAAIARQAGETADRVAPVDPSWSFSWLSASADESDEDLEADADLAA